MVTSAMKSLFLIKACACLVCLLLYFPGAKAEITALSFQSKKDSTFILRGRIFDRSEPPGPIPGVSVMIQGTSKGTVTDGNGNFEISVKTNETLVMSYTGFKERLYHVVTTRNNLTFSLDPDVNTMDEVVVTGFSEQKVKNLANSISRLDVGKAIKNKPITQLSQALQGGITGVTAMQGSGMPGSDGANILIRGISTLGNTSPLVLVDGVPSRINDVDPTTVETVSVLKDAAAASIYGARAANGVILITTKRGVPGKAVITYDGYGGVQNASYLPELVDAPTYMIMVNQAFANIGGDSPYSNETIRITAKGTDPVNYPNTDWRKEILKPNARIQSHSIGLSGGNELARFAVNGTYLNQDGITPLRNYERFAFRANTSVTLTRQLSMLLDMVATRGKNVGEIGRYGPGISNHLYAAIFNTPPNILPKYPVREDGLASYGKFSTDMSNPLAEVEKGGYHQLNQDVININFQPQWEISRSFKLKGQYLYKVLSGGELRNRDTYNFLDYYTNELIYTYTPIKETSLSRSTYNYMAANLEYNRTFAKHFLYGIAGITRESDNPSNFDEINLASYFLKVNYVFDNRFLLETTVRTDGSSRFGPGHKWGTFPSVAVGWNLHNERFLKDLKYLDNFKLRASYGLLGNNQNVGAYQYQSLIDANNGKETIIGNPDLTWETVRMLNLGTDITLFKNLNITVDWFNKTTDNILLSPPLSLSSGIGGIPINAGKVENKGIELQVMYSKDLSDKVSLGFNVGYSYYTNKILELRGGPYIGSSTINKEGYPIGSYYMYKTQGLLQQADIDAGVTKFSGQQAGDIHYTDINGDKKINQEDRQIVGNPNPQGNYFLNFNFKFKNFEFETQVNGFTKSLGYYSGRYQVPLNLTSTSGGTPMTWQLDYWTPEHTGASLPRLTPNPGNNVLVSDYWLVNASFLRFRYMQLGYNVNQKLISKLGLQNLRIYVNAQNPFTVSGMKYIDPETRGNEGTYPLMKMYTLGLNVRF